MNLRACWLFVALCSIRVPALAEAELTTEQLAVNAKPSVVTITFTGRGGAREGLGSGVIVSEDGLIATNLHVIGEARPIRVQMHDGRVLDVESVHATAKADDVALLKVKATGLPALPLGDSTALVDGQSLVAIGNPLGFERSVVTGVLSGRRDIGGREMLQLAIPIEPGNSGGPVLDRQGRVVGLMTLKSLQTSNLGFAIPTATLKMLLERPNPIRIDRWLTIGVLDEQDWTVVFGARWRQRAGRIAVEGTAEGFGGRALCLSTRDVPAPVFEAAVAVRIQEKDGAAGLAFCADGNNRHYGFYPTSGEVRLTRFDGPDVYSWTILRQSRPPRLEMDTWNQLRVRVEAGRIQGYLNGELLVDVRDDQLTAGRIGLCKFRHTSAEFRGFRVGASLPADVPTTDEQEFATRLAAELMLDRPPRTTEIEQAVGGTATSWQALEQEANRLEKRGNRVRQLVRSAQAAATLRELAKLRDIPDSDWPLAHAALLVAQLDNAEVDLAAYQETLNRLVRQAETRLKESQGDQAKLSALSEFLFQEQGFHGSRSAYSSRSNSYLNEVLDDREGLPITLSVVYLELSRRLQLPVVGIGTPGRFLVQNRPEDGPAQLIDPFDRGRPLTETQVRALVSETTDEAWRDEYLQPQTGRAIVQRMLTNLWSRAEADNDGEALLRYVDAMLALDPQSTRHLVMRVALLARTERNDEARVAFATLQQGHADAIEPGVLTQLNRLIEAGSGGR